jgi:hypothetical protein
MRGTWVVAGAALLALGASRVEAQNKSMGIAVIPFAGYSIPGVLASQDDFLEMAPNPAPFFGLQIDLGVSKNMSIGLGGDLTFGGDLALNDLSTSGLGEIGTANITATQFYGVLTIRPSGRRPNGTVTPLAIELGGGMTMWKFDEFLIQGSAIAADDWSGNEPFAFAGMAYNVPIGPRSSVQIFGRAIGGFGYTSDGLDAFNAAPPPTTVEGEFNLTFHIGAGLRVGR